MDFIPLTAYSIFTFTFLSMRTGAQEFGTIKVTSQINDNNQ